MWNAPSPGWSLTAAGGCPTAGSGAMTCGGRCGSPRSTCAGSLRLAFLVTTRPGYWPDQGWRPSRLVCASHDRSPHPAPALSNYCGNDQLLRERPASLDRRASAGSWVSLAALLAMFLLPYLPERLFKGPRTIRHWPRRHICGDCNAPWTDDHTCRPPAEIEAVPPLRGQLRRLDPPTQLERRAKAGISRSGQG